MKQYFKSIGEMKYYFDSPCKVKEFYSIFTGKRKNVYAPGIVLYSSISNPDMIHNEAHCVILSLDYKDKNANYFEFCIKEVIDGVSKKEERRTSMTAAITLFNECCLEVDKHLHLLALLQQFDCSYDAYDDEYVLLNMKNCNEDEKRIYLEWVFMVFQDVIDKFTKIDNITMTEFDSSYELYQISACEYTDGVEMKFVFSHGFIRYKFNGVPAEIIREKIQECDKK